MLAPQVSFQPQNFKDGTKHELSNFLGKQNIIHVAGSVHTNTTNTARDNFRLETNFPNLKSWYIKFTRDEIPHGWAVENEII